MEDREDLLWLGVTRLNADAEGSDGAGDEDFPRGGFASFTGDFNAAAVEALHVVAEAERGELKTIGAEGIGFDDLRASFDIGLMNAEDGFGFRGVEFIKAADGAHRFVQHGAHRTIGDENGIFETLVEILDFHCVIPVCLNLRDSR